MELLEEHGLSALIVQTFDDPPSLPAPVSRTDGFPPEGRQELLRGWLRGRWLRLAPASSLRATLADNPQELYHVEFSSYMEVLQRLIDLSDPDLEGHALALAQGVNPVFGPLLQVKPGEVTAHITRWAQADPTSLRERSALCLQIVSNTGGDLHATLKLRALQPPAPPEPSASS
jgi:hypothetical protein